MHDLRFVTRLHFYRLLAQHRLNGTLKTYSLSVTRELEKCYNAQAITLQCYYCRWIVKPNSDHHLNAVLFAISTLDIAFHLLEIVLTM